MAYDRYDPRRDRDERSRWHDDRAERGRWGGEREWGDRDERGGARDERGWFERAGEEISSWFGGGDHDDDRRRERGWSGQRDRDDERSHRYERGGQERGGYFGWGSERDRDQYRNRERDQYRDRERYSDQNRGVFASGGGSSGRDYNPRQREMWGGGDRRDERGGGYRPMTGDYGRGGRHADPEQFYAASGAPRGRFGSADGRFEDRTQGPWERDDYRRTSYAGSSDQRPRHSHDHDPHYAEWRRRHLEELDRDYDQYRRHHQSNFEGDFGSWREQRQSKRQMLGSVREQMEVVGSDGQRVGTIDRVAGDRLILAKSDPEAGGVHHSIGCTEIDRIEGERVVLSLGADQARQRWRDESRGRALFEREDQGQSGPHVLDRSFEGTYR